MINKDKEVLEDILSYNDAMRVQECIRTAKKYIEISSDSSSSSSYDPSDSGTNQKPTKPVTSSNKSYTCSAKHKSDNEETTLKQPHKDAFMLKQ